MAYDARGHMVICSCEAGRAELSRRMDAVIPPRFRGARLADFPDSVRALVADPGDDGLLVYGPVGCGKTHLAVAVLYHLLDKRSPSEMLFYAVPDLLDDIRATYGGDVKRADVLGAAQDVPILVLDDFGSERVTDWVGEKLYQIINHRYNGRLQTIVTSNLAPSALARRIGQPMGERIASRLVEMCRRVRLDGHDRRTQGEAH